MQTQTIRVFSTFVSNFLVQKAEERGLHLQAVVLYNVSATAATAK
jgi:hypothetical protein